MITRASLEGKEKVKVVAEECKQVLLRIRDEQNKHIIPFQATRIGAAAGIAVMLLLCLTIFPLYRASGEFSAAALLCNAMWSALAGAGAWWVVKDMKASQEISDYLYLILNRLRTEHPDFESINEREKPLMLGELDRLIMQLAMQLKSEIEKPGRTLFLNPNGNPELFTFYPKDSF